ncbi:hypothetical protein EV421DRAFT_1740243 [Armillaria borealis]|uniref:Uncharacterized protein n=1 Tax=Armillaria borealis TaxID=47425 RepID=A0AA39J4Y0_9AGAR|nr:hypothetical protein EV421DRAFT_1740243 [Armillaria borealis]
MAELCLLSVLSVWDGLFSLVILSGHMETFSCCLRSFMEGRMTMLNALSAGGVGEDGTRSWTKQLLGESMVTQLGSRREMQMEVDWVLVSLLLICIILVYSRSCNETVYQYYSSGIPEDPVGARKVTERWKVSEKIGKDS